MESINESLFFGDAPLCVNDPDRIHSMSKRVVDTMFDTRDMRRVFIVHNLSRHAVEGELNIQSAFGKHLRRTDVYTLMHTSDIACNERVLRRELKQGMHTVVFFVGGDMPCTHVDLLCTVWTLAWERNRDRNSWRCPVRICMVYENFHVYNITNAHLAVRANKEMERENRVCTYQICLVDDHLVSGDNGRVARARQSMRDPPSKDKDHTC